MQTYDIITISINDPLYPAAFRSLPDAPAVIYGRGNLALLNHQTKLAVVGSRRVTNYGREVTQSLTKATVRHDIVIVSGLAIGVDSYAHKAAIEAGGQTIAVLPSDLNHIYPRRHTNLASSIVQSGGLLLSEHAYHPDIKPFEFLQRNRLIAALSNAVLVTEAAIRSGTLSTVKHAHELQVPVAAVPGNITSPTSKGSNKLFYDGAQPILDYKDILVLLGVTESGSTNADHRPQNEIQATILQLIGNGEYTTNQLTQATPYSIQQLNIQLALLEINSILYKTAGQTWKIR